MRSPSTGPQRHGTFWRSSEQPCGIAVGCPPGGADGRATIEMVAWGHVLNEGARSPAGRETRPSSVWTGQSSSCRWWSESMPNRLYVGNLPFHAAKSLLTESGGYRDHGDRGGRRGR